jgi:hypothetical protein
MKCKLTGLEGKGVDAHIIPKSFYAIDPYEKLPTRLFTNANGQYTKRSPQGIYDRTIVTEDGERIFSALDDYAAQLLICGEDEFESLHHIGELVAYQVAKYDYVKLKLFFLSVLWRASVSSHHFFRKVNLGPHEFGIREALLSGDPHDTDWFAVTLARWSDHKDGIGMMDPFRERYEGINYYRLYLGNYVVYCKVDQRLPGEAFRSIQLTPERPLIVIARELKKSKEFSIMAQIVRKNEKPI